jgi:hypothetical protein
MKTHVLLAAALAALFMTGASSAGENEFYEASVRPGASAVSRAQVLAELQIWRRSGLAELAQLEVPPLSTREYQAAAARYEGRGRGQGQRRRPLIQRPGPPAARLLVMSRRAAAAFLPPPTSAFQA